MQSVYVLNEHHFEGPVGEGIAIALLAALCFLMVTWARRARSA